MDEFLHHLSSTLILLGGRRDIAEMLLTPSLLGEPVAVDRERVRRSRRRCGDSDDAGSGGSERRAPDVQRITLHDGPSPGASVGAAHCL